MRRRTHSSFGGAAESIDRRKRMRIAAAARRCLAGKPGCPCRFEVVPLERLDPPKLRWIRDGFPV